MATAKKAKIAEPEDKLANARNQARAQYDSISEMVKALRKAEKSDNDDARDDATQRIQEDALSIQVRSGWYTPGADKSDLSRKPCEFEILLCTGGPAVRIVGDVGDHGEPKNARLEFQDWFTPWTQWQDNKQIEETLLAYCRCFYFEEG